MPGSTIPRADAPRDMYLRRGFFSFAQTHLSGLPLVFWGLQLYLFLSMSAIDEHFEEAIRGALPGALSDLGPRMIVGSLTLMTAVGQMISGRMTVPPALRTRQAGWLLAIVGAGLFSTIWAYLPGFASDAFVNLVTSILSFLLIVTIVRTRRELVLTLLVFCLGVGLFLLLSFWEWRGGRYMYAQGVVRMLGAGSQYADPNSFAATLAFMLPLMAWVFVHTRLLWVRICAVGFTGLTMLAVIHTSSRSGLVLTGMALGWTLLFLPRGRMKNTAIIAAVVMVAVLIPQLSKSQIQRIESIFSGRTYAKEESTHGRVQGYVVAWKMFKDNPVFGIGLGNWSEYRQRRMDGSRLLPHNLGGQVLATTGAVGTFIFAGFLISTLMFGFATYRTRKRQGGRWNAAVSKLCMAMLCMYALMLVSGLGAHNMLRPNWFWGSALMLVAVSCRSEEDDEERRLVGHAEVIE